MTEPTTEAGKRLPWNERNPDWWRAQVEERGDIAWQWLANEWAEARAGALDVERLAAAMPDVLSQEACDAIYGPGHDRLDMAEEWYTSPRQMARNILANLEGPTDD
jgi:hypothetical protein